MRMVSGRARRHLFFPPSVTLHTSRQPGLVRPTEDHLTHPLSCPSSTGACHHSLYNLSTLLTQQHNGNMMGKKPLSKTWHPLIILLHSCLWRWPNFLASPIICLFGLLAIRKWQLHRWSHLWAKLTVSWRQNSHYVLSIFHCHKPGVGKTRGSPLYSRQ